MSIHFLLSPSNFVKGTDKCPIISVVKIIKNACTPIKVSRNQILDNSSRSFVKAVVILKPCFKFQLQFPFGNTSFHFTILTFRLHGA